MSVGLGRIILPFSKQFAQVIGVDINSRILDAGALYCEGATNIKFMRTTARHYHLMMKSVDYVYSGGVLQHIKDLGVILKFF